MMRFHSRSCPQLGLPALSVPYSMVIRVGRNWNSHYQTKSQADKRILYDDKDPLCTQIP